MDTRSWFVMGTPASSGGMLQLTNCGGMMSYQLATCA